MIWSRLKCFRNCTQILMESDTTGLEKVLRFVCIASGAVINEIGDIDVCDESSIIAQAGPLLSERYVTQYANLEIFDAQ